MGSPPAEGFAPRFALPVVLGPALNSVNTTMIAVALVPIAEATGTSASEVVLLVASIYLASAVAQPVLGRLVDLYGPRRVYVLGMAVTAVAGLVPLAFPTFAGALVSRVVIGIGTSGVYPAVMTSIRNRSAASGREAPRALFAAVSVSGLVSASVGPVLGGVLVEYLGWQSIFAVNAPYAVVAMVTALLWLPPDRTHVRPAGADGRRPLDLPGVLLFTVAAGSALAAVLGLGPDRHLLVPVAVAAAAGLFLWERRHPLPFLDLRMLAARPELLRTYARLFLVHTCVYLVIYGLTPWLQSAAGYAADTAGWMQVPAVVLAGAAAALVARSRGIRAPLVAAAAVPVAGGLLLTVVTDTAPVWFLLVVMALFGPPQGFSAVSNQVAIQGQAPEGTMGSVSGMSRTAIQVGAITASSVIGSAFGPQITDAGLHLIGWTIVALAASALLLTVTDPALRRPS
ncbi:Putative multidrug resistance protein MdtD [Nocardiopsis dassonvillei]|uniref:MFS transporter n=1 Tax=Nocardiopsis dassonvillei TaxID=2014 RepID=UPI003F55F4CA